MKREREKGNACEKAFMCENVMNEKIENELSLL